jgi:hypothetical protein
MLECLREVARANDTTLRVVVSAALQPTHVLTFTPRRVSLISHVVPMRVDIDTSAYIAAAAHWRASPSREISIACEMMLRNFGCELVTSDDTSDLRRAAANRCDEPGWERVGLFCSADVRSLWVRIEYMGPIWAVEDDGELVPIDTGPLVSIELCSGREGNDTYVRLTPADFVDARAFSDLADVLTTQLWSKDT